ncbi:polyprenyl synthetase family protein [Bavariicoccus seileri]|uniref:polyprenyl synthetase family protein n=1 Tax=Bavariicoccus seileri TaxID=549685 RepID=UPI003F921BCF
MDLHPMWRDYKDLAPELIQVHQLMKDSINLQDNPVQPVLLDLIGAGGKLLRPAYQLLFSRYGHDNDRKKAISIAAAIEMLHTATLIHDDIVDQASTRRKKPTISEQFDNVTAVYAGDYLFVVCFKLMSKYASSMKSLQLNSISMEKILLGELNQMKEHYNLDITINDYLATITGKTAELFSLSCFIGSYESGTSLRFAEKSHDIGKNIGIAFQMVDDILDYTQTSSTIGKPVLADVKQGIYSLPLIYAMESGDERLLALLHQKDKLTDIEAQELLGLVHQLGGVKKAQQMASSYTEIALKQISHLPNDALHTKETLSKITKQILYRKN